MAWRADPGPCSICGTAHSACTDGSGVLRIPLLPATVDAARTVTKSLLGTGLAPSPEGTVVAPAPLEAEKTQATLPEGQFTTGTYRGTKRRSK